MAIKKRVLARNWKFFIETITPKTFERITGLETFSISHSSEELDTTDFDNDGYDSHVIIGRGVELSLEGAMKMDTKTKERCPGQARVEAIAEGFLDDSIAKIHVEDPAGNVYEFTGSVTLGSIGGGTKDKTSWGATIKGTSKLAKLANTSGNTYNRAMIADMTEDEE